MSQRYNYYPLIINSNGLVSGSNNSKYKFTFPAGSVQFKNTRVAVTKVAMYYSNFNITSTYGNNTYQLIFPVFGTLTVTMPDGFYSAANMNSYLQSQMISNGLYLINASGQNVYYAEIIDNSVYYSIQLNLYPVPTALPAGWTAPANWPGYPVSAQTPQFVILANAFRQVIGFTAGTYPSTPQASTYSAQSSFTPQVSPVQSFILTCTLVKNKFNIPNTALYSFTPAGVQFGSLIDTNPAEYAFVEVQDGNYTEFDVQIVDQSYGQIAFQDSNIVIELLIEEPDVDENY